MSTARLRLIAPLRAFYGRNKEKRDKSKPVREMFALPEQALAKKYDDAGFEEQSQSRANEPLRCSMDIGLIHLLNSSAARFSENVGLRRRPE